MPGNVDVVREMYERSGRDDIEGALALMAEDGVLDVSANVFNPAVWVGREGVRTWMREAREVWTAPEVEVVSIAELDDGRLLSEAVLHSEARISGVKVANRLWQLWTIRDGLVQRCVHFNDEAPARAAAARP